MSVFNLAKLPAVCLVCMKPDEGGTMLPIEGEFPNINRNIGDALIDITYHIPKPKCDQLPRSICKVCLEELEHFVAYRSKLMLTLRFMEALLDLRDSKPQPLANLFQTCKPEVDEFFKKLNLCNKEDAAFEDLLKELSAYETTGTQESIVKVELLELAIDVVDESDTKNDEKSDAGSEGVDFKYDSACENDFKSDDEWESNETLSVESPERREPTRRTLRRRKRTIRDRKISTAEKKSKLEASANIESTSKKKRGRPRIHPDGTFLKEPWSCDKCKFKTKYRLAVERHKAVHLKRENRTYTCSECAEVFKTYEEMRTHSMNHPQNQVVCEVCGTSLKNAYSLKAHMERHEDIRKYCCEYCDYASNTKLALQAHMSIHTKNGWNKRCEVCGVVFRTTSRLKRHMESHDNERKYACEQCPVRFNTTNALRNHFIRVHLAIRHACDYCEKTFDQKIALRDHIERIHHIQCTFICDICVITYDSRQKLEAHKQRHSNPKPMECSVCLTLHLNQTDFDKHLCITYRQDYQCCNKDLRNHIQYNKHMMVKHGLRTNARVKPIPGVLLGELRAARKRLEQCRKCDIAFPSRALKLQHLAICNRQNELQYTVPADSQEPAAGLSSAF
ncbi:zinc finger protein 729-like [Sabethes cyaneus]|uniref:zinc finger protein 729-like n=1 Tax=Sabethes cyaneus TaxID=53552 RepID=UPI00237D39F6|nr:zinc finger protein 729-like [Sabethes cyaneus]